MVDEQRQPTDYVVGGPTEAAAPAQGGGFAPSEGGITQGGTRPTVRTRRFEEARAHVEACADEKTLTDRVGTCDTLMAGGSTCGATVPFGQTECPHAVLITGTCPNCGTVHTRAGKTAGWTGDGSNTPAQPQEA
jgi:hypothetical protein